MRFPREGAVDDSGIRFSISVSSSCGIVGLPRFVAIARANKTATEEKITQIIYPEMPQAYPYPLTLSEPHGAGAPVSSRTGAAQPRLSLIPPQILAFSPFSRNLT